jgi:hypothetical protein
MLGIPAVHSESLFIFEEEYVFEIARLAQVACGRPFAGDRQAAFGTFADLDGKLLAILVLEYKIWISVPELLLWQATATNEGAAAAFRTCEMFFELLDLPLVLGPTSLTVRIAKPIGIVDRNRGC